MNTTSLFGEIALKIGAHPEDLATEALLYVLRRYPEANKVLISNLKRTETDIPTKLVFRSQGRGEDQTRPDLIGRDGDGSNVLIIEAKFWAGLTEAQPNSYLEQLPLDKPGILVVLCPGKRLQTLWNKLILRCIEAGLQIGEATTLATEYRFTKVNKKDTLAIISWRTIISVFEREAETASNQALLSDVRQLSGLCARMDSEAFVPLRAEDLSSSIAWKVQHFANLVDQVVAQMVSDHGAEKRSLSTGGSQSAYGRYFFFEGYILFFFYSPLLWARYGETPIWLQIWNEEWGSTPEIEAGIACMHAGKYIHVPATEDQNILGLDPKLRSEQQDVISDMIRQVKEAVQSCHNSRT